MISCGSESINLRLVSDNLSSSSLYFLSVRLCVQTTLVATLGNPYKENIHFSVLHSVSEELEECHLGSCSQC